ncbi:YihY/virulence factor BrkB family protein [Lutimaribacter marinistellae]|uniref:YihY/virulence factor BrkB family protein n=1 Tax=Lutimaribacter marinistellae TaxID=1820329 RepID=A0ABV7TQ25_9RHOB
MTGKPGSQAKVNATGSTAERPGRIPRAGLLQVAGRIWTRLTQDNISLVSAGVGFYGLLALFPAMAALVAMVGIVTDPAQVVAEADTVLAAVPEAARSIIVGQLTDLASTSDNSLGLAALLALSLSLYSASRGTASVISGLNIAYEEEEKRGFIKLQAVVLVLTLVGIVVLLAMVFLTAAVPALLAVFGEGQAVEIAARVLRWPVMIGLAIVLVAVLFRFGPSRRKARWRWLAPGSVVAVLLWAFVNLGFSWYVSNFASYNETFGALAGVIVLLMWLYLSAFVILVGAVIDAELEAQTARDSTVGEPRPMGQRGAVKADSCEAEECG